MSTLQWLFIVAAAFAGYFAVSWLIARSSRKQQKRPIQYEASPPPASSSDSRSVWDEFNGSDKR